jgi:hypothetical protein
MGMYVYRVTKDRVVIDGKDCQVAKFAYKPTYSGQQVGDKYISAEQINAKWAFKSGCMAKTNITTDYIVTVSNDKVHATIYGNPNRMRTFYDDVTMGTERMPLIASYELRDGVYHRSEEEQYA